MLLLSLLNLLLLDNIIDLAQPRKSSSLAATQAQCLLEFDDKRALPHARRLDKLLGAVLMLTGINKLHHSKCWLQQNTSLEHASMLEHPLTPKQNAAQDWQKPASQIGTANS